MKCLEKLLTLPQCDEADTQIGLPTGLRRYCKAAVCCLWGPSRRQVQPHPECAVSLVRTANHTPAIKSSVKECECNILSTSCSITTNGYTSVLCKWIQTPGKHQRECEAFKKNHVQAYSISQARTISSSNELGWCGQHARLVINYTCKVTEKQLLPHSHGYVQPYSYHLANSTSHLPD